MPPSVKIAFAIGAELAISTHAGMIRERPWLSLLIAPAGFWAQLVAFGLFRFFGGANHAKHQKNNVL